MSIPSPSPEPTGENVVVRVGGGSAATGSDPRVPADIAVESGDADGGKEPEFSESQDAEYDCNAAATLVTQTNQANSAKKAAKAAKKAAKKAATAEDSDCMVVELESTPNSQETNFIARCRNLITLMFTLMFTSFNAETDKEETRKKTATLQQMQTKIMTSNFSECTEALRATVKKDGATHPVRDGSLLFGLPMGVDKALIPVLKWLLLSADAVPKEVTVVQRGDGAEAKEDGADEEEEEEQNDDENEAGSSKKATTDTKTVKKTVFTHAAKSIDQMYAVLHPKLMEAHKEFKEAGIELSEPMSIEEVMKKDSGFKPIKDGVVSTSHQGFLLSIVIRWINELMGMNLSIVTKPSSKSCNTLFKMLVYIAKLSQMALLKAAEIKKAKKEASKARRAAATAAANGDDGAKDAIPVDDDEYSEEGNFWHLKGKKFADAFAKWSRTMNIDKVASYVHANGRTMTAHLLSRVQMAEYEDYKKEQKKAENAARTAKHVENARLVKELQAEVETLRAQVSVAPVEGAAGGAFPMAIPVQGGAMAKLREKIAELEKALEDAKDDLAEANDALGGTRLTLEMAEKKYEDYVEEKIVDMRELVHTAADNQMELEEALENAQDRAWELNVKLGSTKTELQKMTKQYEESKKKADQLASEMARYLEATGPKKRTASEAFGEASVPAEASAEASAEAAAPQGGSPAAAALRRSVRPRRS